MDLRKRLRIWSGLTLGVTLSACTAPLAEYVRYAGTEKDKAVWQLLDPGSRVALFDPTKKCNATIADSVAALNGGPAVGDTEWGDKITVWTVDGARVQTSGETGDVLINLHNDATKKVLRYGMGQAGGCLFPATPAIDGALARVGKTVAYAPATPACVAIEAAGSRPDALFFGGGAPTLAIEAVEIGPASASRLLEWDMTAPPALWLRAKGDLHVRADTVASCFAATAPPPAEVVSLVRTPIGRCEVEQRHVRCASSLGTWEGVSSLAAVSLRMVRRTLGALDIVDGRPVHSGRFARSVVAIEMAKPKDARETALYAAMQRTVQVALAGGDGSVRAVPPDDPDATLHISVALQNLVIGDLVQRVTMEQTTYEDHKETQPNPEKETARSAVENASTNVDQAIQDFHTRQDTAKAAHDACLSACSGQYANICRTGCNVGGVILTAVVDSDPSVQQARTALNQARSKEASTPATIQVPIMLPWQYKRTSYQRSVSVALDVDAKFPSGPRHLSSPMATSVDDYEVGSDPRHNVTGHAANRDIIDKPDSLLPLIGRMIADELGKRVRAGVSQEREERAVKAFEAAGHEAARPENRPLDAAAFDIGGARVQKPVGYGVVDFAAAGFVTVPVQSAAPMCLLVVASANDPEAHVKLITPDASHADLRGGSVAAIELCPGEPESASVNVSTTKGAQVRWGAYITAPGK
jgi:hypothetical protein